MAISAETIAAAAETGLSITQVPISASYIKNGSTLNPVAHGLGGLGQIITMISERKPFFFFGVSGIILTVLGFLAGLRVIRIASVGGGVAMGTALVAVLLIILGVSSIFAGVILRVLTKKD